MINDVLPLLLFLVTGGLALSCAIMFAENVFVCLIGERENLKRITDHKFDVFAEKLRFRKLN